MKAHLLDLLFSAIDSSHLSYLDRSELLLFIRHEPYLSSPHLQPVVAALLSRLSHDEDSHCSRREWHAALAPLPPADITRLLVNLIRRMPLPGRRLQHTITMMERAETREDEAGGKQGREATEHRMSVYLEDMLFHSVDASLDHRVDEAELAEFLRVDPFFAQRSGERDAVQSLYTQLQQHKQSAGATDSGGGLTQDEFVAIFSGFSLQQVDELFIHLLTRTTHSSLTESGSASRHAHKPVRHKQMLQDVMRQHVPAHTQQPCQLVHGGQAHRQQPAEPETLQAAAAMPPSALPPPHGVRLTLLGQSLIQYDLRQTEFGRHVLASMPPYLTADIVFSELETSISRDDGSGGQQQRHTVFQHNAPPAVLDCLKQLGANMLALANNHAGDMGEEGVRVALEEVRKRGFVCAGIGMNEEEATRPAFATVTPLCWRLKHGERHHAETDTESSSSTTTTAATPSPSTSPPPMASPPLSPPLSPALQSACPPSVTVALVAHASKIPPGTAATPTRAGVNSLSMADIDTCTLNELECARILRSTSEARQRASIVIAYQHNHFWSGSGKVNEEHEMGAWKRMWAHALIDSGATVYVSHGDPRLQGIEIYNGCPLFFCLGSFIFQTRTEVGFYGPEVWQSCVVTLEYHSHSRHAATCSAPARPTQQLDPQRAKAAHTAPLPSPTFSIRLTPITLNEVGRPPEPPELHYQTRGLPSVARGAEGRRILEHVAAMSAQFGTVVEIEEEQNGDGGVVGWVTGGGKVRVGEPADPTVAGAEGKVRQEIDGHVQTKPTDSANGVK